MKKLVSLVLATVMCLSMVACGGVDKQPAIDAFNNANGAFTELANAMNENLDLYSEEFVDVMMQMSASLAECKALLESDQELTEEDVAALVSNLNDIEAWVADATGLAEEEAAAEEVVEEEVVVAEDVVVDMDAAIEVFNGLTTAFDAMATEVNNNADAFSEEFIDEMIAMSEVLAECKAGLESGVELSEEEYVQLIEVFVQIEEWLAAVESEVWG